MNLLITGATGFVGRELVAELLGRDMSVLAVVRRPSSLPSEARQVVVEDLLSGIEWKEVLQKIDVVIHLAARVHIMNETVSEPLAAFRKVNVDGTLNLAKQATESGVKRFIYISSIKVNGEMTMTDCPFRPDDTVQPIDSYGLSKHEAEQGLLAMAKSTTMEVVVIRPPLVYGPGVRANFLSMMNWMHKGIPLPFGAVNNRRSLIALDNLVSFIIQSIDHPKAANEVFLISDDEDVSTTKLLQKVAKAFGKKSLLIPVPVSWMKFVAKLISKEDMTSRLFSSLQVDSSKAHDLLDWKPVVTMDEQLKKTADAFLNEKII